VERGSPLGCEGRVRWKWVFEVIGIHRGPRRKLSLNGDAVYYKSRLEVEGRYDQFGRSNDRPGKPLHDGPQTFNDLFIRITDGERERRSFGSYMFVVGSGTWQVGVRCIVIAAWQLASMIE
jgi:hypothetical protein